MDSLWAPEDAGEADISTREATWEPCRGPISHPDLRVS